VSSSECRPQSGAGMLPDNFSPKRTRHYRAERPNGRLLGHVTLLSEILGHFPD
jgi:hypothetical protein